MKPKKNKSEEDEEAKKKAEEEDEDETEDETETTEGEEEEEDSEAEAEKGMTELMERRLEKKLDAIAERIAGKFMSGVTKQRKAVAAGLVPAKAKGDTHIREYFAALFNHDNAWLKAAGYLDTGTVATAGYLIPETFLAEVLRVAEKQYGLARRDFRYLPFSGAGNSRKIPTLAGSVTVTWTDEAVAKTSTKPTFGLVTQTLKKLAAIVPMTDELLEDSAINIEQLLAELFAEAIAKEEDIQFFRGTGSPWTGIVNNSSVNIVRTATTAMSSVTADKLLDMIDAVPSGARDGAKFYLHSSILSLIRKLKDDQNNYIFQRPGDGLPGTLWDYPYEVTDAMPDVSTTAADKPMVLFGNLKVAAVFGDKQQLRIKLLDQAVIRNVGNSADLNLATQDMSALRIVERVGYVLAIPTAVSVLKTATGS